MPFKDISRQVYGKYQFCTMVNGLWYSDEDFTLGNGCGKLKPGAVPRPDTLHPVPSVVVDQKID